MPCHSSSKMEETKEQNTLVVDESRKPYTEITIGYERWTHNTYKMELVYKFYQEQGEPRVLVGEQFFFERTGEDSYGQPKLIDQYNFTESLHVTKIRSEEDYVKEQFVVDMSVTRQNFKDATLREAAARLESEELSAYEDELTKLFEGLDMEQVMAFEMHGLYESNVHVRVPSFDDPTARLYLARFHSIDKGESWSTREIELERAQKELQRKELQEELD